MPLAALVVVTLCIGLGADPARASTAASDGASSCHTWSARTIASGLGSLENIAFDGQGGLLISATSRDAVERLTRGGKRTTLVSGLKGPGGLRVRGNVLYFNTGDTLQAGLLGTPDGTIGRLDLRTHARSTWARGLTMPNGLAFLPDGDAVVSRDVTGPGIQSTGITRVPARAPRHPRTRWAALEDTNGLAVDPSGRWLYADETFTRESRVYRIRIADPREIGVVAELGGVGVPKGLDDLTIDRAGVLFLAANGAGEVIRLDPRTGASCVIVSGLQNPSALKFGRGPGWSCNRLYAVGFDGRVRELIPPARPRERGSCVPRRTRHHRTRAPQRHPRHRAPRFTG